MSNDKRTKETITLGSGYLYIDKFTGEIPTNENLEKDDCLAGYIKGGATLEYTPTPYTAKDDFGKVRKTIITDEEAKLKSGIMTWNANTLKKLVATGRVTEANGKRTIKIGGLSKDDKEKYVIRFVHKDEVDGDVRITIVGKNTAGFSLAFAKDAETVIDVEFEAMPSDADGTLIIFEEEIKETA